jgi:colanic acid/amylovoran biosynthesis glycosyltransferase
VKPLRVAYLVSRFPDFSEGFVRYEMTEVSRRSGGLLVLPLVRGRGEGTAKGGGGEEITAAAEVAEVPPLSSKDLWLEIFRLAGRRPVRLLRVLLTAAAALFLSPREGLKWLLILPRMLYMVHLVEGGKIDHLHAHFAALPAEAAWTISSFTGIPYSVTAHAYDIYLSPRLLRKKVSAAAFGVAVSEYSKDLLERAGPYRKGFRWHLIRNGVPLDIFRPPGKRTSPGTCRILFVGRLVPKKGLDLLIEAAAIMQDRGLSFECVIVGAGELLAGLRKRASALGVTGSVRFAGVLSGEDLREAYRESDIFVLPSRPAVRGGPDTLPVVLTEAMAMGLPVVSTRVAAIPELVEDGVSGLLVPPADAAALAEALERLAGDEALRNALAAAALEKVAGEYDVVATAGKLTYLFREASTGR